MVRRKAPLTRRGAAERNGIRRFCRLLDAMKEARKEGKYGIRCDRQAARTLVREALATPTEERHGFERAMAEYLLIISDGLVPDGASLASEFRLRWRRQGGAA